MTTKTATSDPSGRPTKQFLEEYLLNTVHASRENVTHKYPNYWQLEILRKQITDLLHYKAKAALQICRKMNYESGNKCGRLLARSVREQKSAAYIPQIKRPDGQKVTLLKQISHEFRDFYHSLYNLPNRDPPQADIDKYITSSQMPSLPMEVQGKQGTTLSRC